MTSIQIADFCMSVLQEFLLANLICRHFEIKYKYGFSMLFSMALIQILYIVDNYAIFLYRFRFVLGILFFYIIGVILLQGSMIKKLILSVFIYAFIVCIDLLNYLLLYSWLGLSFTVDKGISLRLLLGRNYYNVLLYLVLVILEVWKNKNRGKNFKFITFLGLVLGTCQLFSMKNLYQANASALTANAVVLSVFYSGVVIVGYFFVLQLFELVVQQQKKQSELEQISLERRYQYDYYQKAYTRSEEIRDMRHDMRNQLQAIQYLFQSEGEENRRRAEEMVNQLCGKVR